jgi:hypothetical protein
MTRTLAALLFLLAYPTIGNGDDSGRFCVSSAEQHPENMSFLEYLGLARNDFQYTIQLDDGPQLPTNPKSGFTYPLDDVEATFLVKIRRDDEIVEAFTVDLAKFEANQACLWFKPLYETWSLWELQKSKHLCDCDS